MFVLLSEDICWRESTLTCLNLEPTRLRIREGCLGGGRGEVAQSENAYKEVFFGSLESGLSASLSLLNGADLLASSHLHHPFSDTDVTPWLPKATH